MLSPDHQSDSCHSGKFFEAPVKFNIILEALSFMSLLASSPKGLKKLNFSSKGLRNVKILDMNVSLLLIPNKLKFLVLLY